MLTKTCLCVALFLAACVDLPTDDGDQVGAPAPAAVALELALALELEPVCPIVADDGPCAVACDPEAIRAFIQPGTCVTFRCYLADGTETRAGGCN